MSSWIREAILDRLHGTHIHIDPLLVIEELAESDAIKTPCIGTRSPKELLFHIVYWLEYSLSLINQVPLNHLDGADWKTNDVKWLDLVERFRIGLSRLEFMTENLDFKESVKIDDELYTCVGAEILGVVQHTSYHLGQLVMSRRALGKWIRK
jgi:hypothetical protein